jgi:toxin ParE1/3/4
MKKRQVILSPDALDDLDAMYTHIAANAGATIAENYLQRLEVYVLGFDLASERGTIRNDIRKGLRIVGFERRITIAFTVTPSRVSILRFFWGGQNWQKVLAY